jgi:hypothetical protein
MVSIQSLRELDFPSANSMSERVRKPPKCDSAENKNKEFKFEATSDSGKWNGP